MLGLQLQPLVNPLLVLGHKVIYPKERIGCFLYCVVGLGNKVAGSATWSTVRLTLVCVPPFLLFYVF